MTSHAKTHGTAVLTCKNHPTYRWVHTKYAIPDSANPYIGHGTLMFEGEEKGKPASYWNMTEAKLRLEAKSVQVHYRSLYTPECDCPFEDLVFLRWADDGA